MKKDLSIYPENTIVEAIKRLNKTGEKVLFVVNKEKILLGTITDGDIRRFILSKGNIKGFVNDCYNRNPIYFYEKDLSKDKIKKIMYNKKVEIVPILDEKKRIVNYVRWSEFLEDGEKNKFKELDIPVVIMAGGRGTRLKPLTKVIPKPLIPVGEKTMIEYAIESFLKHNIKKFYITINYKGELIKSYFENLEKDYEVYFIEEKDFLGTAGSLYYLKDEIKTDFIVSNCDVILDIDYSKVFSFHKSNESVLTSITSLKQIKVPYGVIEIEKGGMVKEIIEKPEYTFQINTGVYFFNDSVFEYIKKEEYIDMPELFIKLKENGERVFAYPISEMRYIDLGEWKEYEKNIGKLEGFSE